MTGSAGDLFTRSPNWTLPYVTSPGADGYSLCRDVGLKWGKANAGPVNQFRGTSCPELHPYYRIPYSGAILQRLLLTIPRRFVTCTSVQTPPNGRSYTNRVLFCKVFLSRIARLHRQTHPNPHAQSSFRRRVTVFESALTWPIDRPTRPRLECVGFKHHDCQPRVP